MSTTTEQYTQCCLQKPLVAGGFLKTTSWIPSQFAVKGSYVRLRGLDKVWIDGWEVVQVGAKATYAETWKLSQDHKHQRAASDI